MANRLDITSGQEDATQRNDLAGVVYLLSGTLKGRGAIPDADFCWANYTFSGALGAFEHYIAQPRSVLRGMEYLAGEGISNPAIRIPVHNLPFQQSESLLAAFSDEAYAWEHSTASLRVGYLKPGQEASDLAASDWTFLVKEGFLGAPQDIESDGFNAILYHRGARRNQSIRQPIIEAGGAEANDLDAIGTPWPVIAGKPDSWIPLKAQAGVRGFTVSGYDAGETVIQFKPISAGVGSVGPDAGVKSRAWQIHYRTPFYPKVGVTSGAVIDPETGIWTITLGSGLAASVPRGAYVQESAPTNGFRWYLAGHAALPTGTDLAGYVGFKRSDGTIVVADSVRWPFEVQLWGGLDNGYDGFGTYLRLPYGGSSDPNVPVFFDPLGEEIEVSQQPTFSTTSKETMGGKINRATGGSGVENEKLRDGSEETGTPVAEGEDIYLTFPSAPGNFDDDDTTASVLHFVAEGFIRFTNAGGGTEFAEIAQAGALHAYAIAQGSPRDYNETVRIVGQAGGGTVAEVWWEHDLEADVSLDRDDDVIVGPGSGIGELMEFAGVVVRIPNTSGNSILGNALNAAGSLVSNPWRQRDLGATDWRARPPAVLAGLQGYFLGEEGSLATIDSASYDRADAFYAADDFRLNFVLLDRVQSWTDLELRFAEQSRAQMFYGPSGHEILYMQERTDLEDIAVKQSFRLPGVPGANCRRGTGPIMERTPVSNAINVFEIEWNLDYAEGSTYLQTVSAQETESVAAFGARRDTRGVRQYWAHSPIAGHPTHDAEAQVSGLAQFFADRYAFPSTRFAVNTSWIAHGLDRGSVVRVAYKIAENAFRNVVCEVEEIQSSPINSELFSVVCRGVGPPARGYEPAIVWTDLFTSIADSWSEKITSEYDTWDVYFAPSGSV